MVWWLGRIRRAWRVRRLGRMLGVFGVFRMLGVFGVFRMLVHASISSEIYFLAFSASVQIR
jgi:hypothetical protein